MQLIKSLWSKIPQNWRHVIHTVWQVALGALLAHATMPHSTQDVKATVAIVYSAALSALKLAVLKYVVEA